jgi:outer membrane protein OmpA-like peptidoglycan-associated protein
MRHWFALGLLLCLAGCSLFAPSGRRFVIYFDPSSSQVIDTAKEVIVGAAAWAKDHPDKPVLVAAFADINGTEKANAGITHARAQAVIDVLVANGVPAARIQPVEVGSVSAPVNTHESRRVEVTIGTL